MSAIQDTLKGLFQSHRVIFWYDPERNLEQDLMAAQMAGVEKRIMNHDEFAVRHAITTGKKDARYLLYFPYPEPPPTDNWLLDLQLAHHVFHTDQAGIFLQEMKLDLSHKPFLQRHIEFFRSRERRDKWRAMTESSDRETVMLRNMMAVALNAGDPGIDALTRARILAWQSMQELPERDMDRFRLNEPFWKEVSVRYGYDSDRPSVYDLVLFLFRVSATPAAGGHVPPAVRVLLSNWKEHVHAREAFRALARRVEQDLSIEQWVEKAPLEDLLEDDLYPVVERRIVHELARRLAGSGMSVADFEAVLLRRRDKFWFKDHEHSYQALSHAAALLETIAKESGLPAGESLSEGLSLYAGRLWKVDQDYRKFIVHYRESAQIGVLGTLYEKVHRVYAHEWLYRTGNWWDEILERSAGWLPPADSHHQLGFFERQVRPVLQRPQRLFVLISDALRYECAQELLLRLHQEKRFSAEMDYMVTALPSYTQLGMAALLPHGELTLTESDLGVRVDGRSTVGLDARRQLLQVLPYCKSTAIGAEELMAMPTNTVGREFAKAHDLIYVYHNRIDKTGDDASSEEKVFDAVEEELTFLMQVIKKIGNMNAYHILVTADHGFLYQHEPLQESDFSEPSIQGKVWKRNRRFVIGEGLRGDAVLRPFRGEDLGLQQGLDILVPRGMQRLRVQGAGSRYVHGGSSLQEVVVPLLTVMKMREDTAAPVEIDIIQSSDRITTNLLRVTFLQKQPVGEKFLSRRLRVSLVDGTGQPISDVMHHTFDYAEQSDRQRAYTHAFQLSLGDGQPRRQQRVSLLLEEPIPDTSQWKKYKTFQYTLNISFSTDFDDF